MYFPESVIRDQRTVLGNNCSRFIDSPHARTGILDNNPIRRDMLSAAEQIGLAYIVNVMIDEQKRTVAAFAGEPKAAHAAGCSFLRPYCEVAAQPADLVITTNGGAPFDQNLYQCVKGLTAAEAAAKDGAPIILAAECADGTGGDQFYRALRDCKTLHALYERYMQIPQDQTEPDQWESQILSRVLMHHPVIVVTRKELRKIVEDMKMHYAPDMERAIETAKEICPNVQTMTIIPNGVSVIVRTQM